MKRGRPSWTKRCAPALVRRVDDAIRAARDSAREIYDRENLARYTRRNTFQHYVGCRRRDLAARQTVASEPGKLAPDVPRSRWGVRGLRRLRRMGLDSVGPAVTPALAWQALLDAAEQLRTASDRLVDLALSFRLDAEGDSMVEGTK